MLFFIYACSAAAPTQASNVVRGLLATFLGHVSLPLGIGDERKNLLKAAKQWALGPWSFQFAVHKRTKMRDPAFSSTSYRIRQNFFTDCAWSRKSGGIFTIVISFGIWLNFCSFLNAQIISLLDLYRVVNLLRPFHICPSRSEDFRITWRWKERCY